MAIHDACWQLTSVVTSGLIGLPGLWTSGQYQWQMVVTQQINGVFVCVSNLQTKFLPHPKDWKRSGGWDCLISSAIYENVRLQNDTAYHRNFCLQFHRKWPVLLKRSGRFGDRCGWWVVAEDILCWFMWAVIKPPWVNWLWQFLGTQQLRDNLRVKDGYVSPTRFGVKCTSCSDITRRRKASEAGRRFRVASHGSHCVRKLASNPFFCQSQGWQFLGEVAYFSLTSVRPSTILGICRIQESHPEKCAANMQQNSATGTNACGTSIWGWGCRYFWVFVGLCEHWSNTNFSWFWSFVLLGF